MKLKLIALFSLMATLGSNAALYSVSNSIGDNSVGITEADGLPGAASTTRGFQTTEATIAFGVFSIDDTAIAGAASTSSLFSSFVQFGTNVRNFTATTGGANGVATPTSTTDVAVTGNATFVNKNIYVLVVNASSFANITGTTQALVLKLDRQFLAADDAFVGTQALTYNTTNATLVLGGFNNHSFRTRTADTTITPAWNTVSLPVPETSTSLLGAIGALALLRRRRN